MIKYKFLLFDADNTLLDFDENERVSIAATLRHFGIRPTDEIISVYHNINKDYWRMYDEKRVSRDELLWRRFVTLYERLGVNIDPFETEDYYREMLDSGYQLIPGAAELCKELRLSHKVYIITNGVAQTQHKRLDGSGLSRVIDGAFISDEIGFHKPEKGFFEYVSQNIEGFEKKSALVIGDSLSSDIQGGINFGIDTCWYNPESLKNTTEFTPEYEAADFDDIRKIVG